MKSPAGPTIVGVKKKILVFQEPRLLENAFTIAKNAFYSK